MKITRRQFKAAWRVHSHGPRFSATWRARGAHSPGPFLSGGTAQCGSVQRRVLLQPASLNRRAGGQRAADRHRLVAGCARAASAPHRPQGNLRPRSARVHSTDRLRKPDALAFHRDRHLVDCRSAKHAESRLGGPLSRFAAVAGGAARRMEYDQRVTARPAGGARRGPGHRQPQARARSRARTPAPKPPPSGRQRSASIPTCRSIAPSSRSSARTRRRRWRRSTASRRSPHTPSVTYPTRVWARPFGP